MAIEVIEFDLISSLEPAEIWARSPLNRERIDAVLAGPGLPLVVPAAQSEALRLTFAKLLDLALPHILLFPKEGSNSQFDKYVHAVIALQKEWNSVNKYRNCPPQPPSEWMAATVSWMKGSLRNASRNGRTPEIGHADFFRPVLAFYTLAFGRPPSATPRGPTFRFVRILWSQLAMAITEPKWPPMSDAAMLARIGQNRIVADEDCSFAEALLARFSEDGALQPPMH